MGSMPRHLDGGRARSGDTARRVGAITTMRLTGAAKTAGIEATGWFLLLGGLAAIPLPGPGLLITFSGLLLLSRRYAWAERRVDLVRARALDAAATSVATGLRLAVSVGGAALAAAAGVAWITSPSAPLWWPLAQRWWLPGGVVVGVTQLVSAVVALALLGYGYRRFPRRPEPTSPREPVHRWPSPANRSRGQQKLMSLGARADARGRSTCATNEALR